MYWRRESGSVNRIDLSAGTGVIAADDVGEFDDLFPFATSLVDCFLDRRLFRRCALRKWKGENEEP
jgi:hypothetical protein